MTHRVLIVGLGQIGMGYDLNLDAGRFVLSHARAFGSNPDFALVAGVDPLPERTTVFGRSYGAATFVDLPTALRDSSPDVVVIACPTAQHGAVLRMVLQLSRPRVVLCEKPLSYDIAEARTMVALCEAAGCDLFVNYARRSDPAALAIRTRLASGAMAGPVKGVAWYTKGLLHTGSHFFNLIELWLGDMESFTVIEKGRLWDGLDPEPDVRVRFAGGSVDFLAAREECFSLHEIELVAQNGRLRYEQGGGKISWQAAATDPTTPEYTVLSADGECIPADPGRSQAHVAREIANHLAGRPASLCSGSAALRTLESLTAIGSGL